MKKPVSKVLRRPLKPVQAGVVQKRALQVTKNASAKKPTVPTKVVEPESLTNEQIIERQQKIIVFVHVIHKQLSEHSHRANIPPPPAIPVEFAQAAGKTDPASTSVTTEYYTAFQTWMDQHIKKP